MPVRRAPKTTGLELRTAVIAIRTMAAVDGGGVGGGAALGADPGLEPVSHALRRRRTIRARLLGELARGVCVPEALEAD